MGFSAMAFFLKQLVFVFQVWVLMKTANDEIQVSGIASYIMQFASRYSKITGEPSEAREAYY